MTWTELIRAAGHDSTHQVELACDINPGYLSNYLNGHYDPERMQAGTVLRLAATLKVTPEVVIQMMRAEAASRQAARAEA